MYPQNNFNENTQNIANKTWGIVDNTLAGFIDGAEATVQSIRLRISNILGEHMIYSRAYGSRINTLLGETYDMICLKLPGIIEEAVLLDDRVTGVDNFEFNRYLDNIFVKFRIILFRDSLDMEVII